MTDKEVGELITDKEVGELWCHIGSTSAGALVRDLIRKLVEERAKVRHYVDLPQGEGFSDSPDNHQERYRQKARRDFGILED